MKDEGRFKITQVLNFAYVNIHKATIFLYESFIE